MITCSQALYGMGVAILGLVAWIKLQYNDIKKLAKDKNTVYDRLIVCEQEKSAIVKSIYESWKEEDNA